jgi:hypothetical protein
VATIKPRVAPYGPTLDSGIDVFRPEIDGLAALKKILGTFLSEETQEIQIVLYACLGVIHLPTAVEKFRMRWFSK